uniref:Uncharacterized protein n=1 Tax=Octopus bimaculoides TaxID=37653 RepID=A0A0L8HXS5_OCTBM
MVNGPRIEASNFCQDFQLQILSLNLNFSNFRTEFSNISTILLMPSASSV